MSSVLFYVNGVQKNAAVCGDAISFDIPGYSQVWLTQYQNGKLQFDGPYNLPSPPYQTSCANDVGTFQGTAYELINGQKGAVLGSWTFQVAPLYSGIQTVAVAPSSQCLTGLCTPQNPSTATTTTVVSPSPQVPYAPGPGISPGNAPGGLNPFGDLPGSIPTATLGGTSQVSTVTQPETVPMGQFDWLAFVKSHLFWLLVALLVLIWLLTKDGQGRG